MNATPQHDEFLDAMRIHLAARNHEAWLYYQSGEYKRQSQDNRARAHRALKRGYVGDFKHFIRQAIREWSLHRHYHKQAGAFE